jgi:hypothetical protein
MLNAADQTSVAFMFFGRCRVGDNQANQAAEAPSASADLPQSVATSRLFQSTVGPRLRGVVEILAEVGVVVGGV